MTRPCSCSPRGGCRLTRISARYSSVPIDVRSAEIGVEENVLWSQSKQGTIAVKIHPSDMAQPNACVWRRVIKKLAHHAGFEHCETQAFRAIDRRNRVLVADQEQRKRSQFEDRAVDRQMKRR